MAGNLAIGSEGKLEAPGGGATLQDTQSRPAVFILGGIGVTPVLRFNTLPGDAQRSPGVVDDRV